MKDKKEPMEVLIERLLNKSKESFIMAIELYNKPTIRYRVEGFSMFICNAWELMLKSYIMKKFGEKDIYYKDHPERTITLENCIKKVFTNNKDPLRLNLDKIIELRNTSTHFITEDYEMVYVPLFQACILNYNEKMSLFHNIDMTLEIPQNFLTLAISMKALDENDIIAKYPEEIAQKFLSLKNNLDEIIVENNSKFAIRIDHYHYITKDKNKATSFVKIKNDANAEIKIIKELKDPNDTHKYTAKSCIKSIKDRLGREGIDLKFKGNKRIFNNYDFQNICKYYNLKANEKFCYTHKQFANNQHTYSQQAIDFIFEELRNDSDHILDHIKNKLTLGAKEF